MGKPRTVIRDVLTADEARWLCRPSDVAGTLALVTSYGLVAASFAVCAIWPSPLSVFGALVVIGGRQLALAILMHEAAHRTLFAARRLNDLIGGWLCGAPTWNHLDPYRIHHLAHHRHTGSPRDPDLYLVTPFPTSRLGLVRRLARDALGLTGIRRVLGLLAMDLGYITYTASGDSRPIEPPLSLGARLGLCASRLGPVVVTNAALFAVLAALGHGTLYWLWPAAYMTTFSVFLRIRAMAEHAAVPDPLDPMKQTRTTLAGPLARLTVAPHRVNYHLEHHLWMGVPQHRLPVLHKLLTARGVLSEACVEPNYRSVLRKLASAEPEA